MVNNKSDFHSDLELKCKLNVVVVVVSVIQKQNLECFTTQQIAISKLIKLLSLENKYLL